MNIRIKTTPYHEERRQTIHRHHYRNHSHSLRRHRSPKLNLFPTLVRISGSRYFIALINGRIAGGAGIYPSPGLPGHVCELVKMYLGADSQYGYRQVYIETMPALQKAMSIYEKFGFRYLQGPMGNTGHYSCTIWMLKEL
jgi:hypothetical protein